MMRLIDLINLLPDKPWDWDGISCNPNITLEIIRDNSDMPWKWDDISWKDFMFDLEKHRIVRRTRRTYDEIVESYKNFTAS
jgi:hypothetical protein